MKQIKPEVIGYKCIKWGVLERSELNITYTKDKMISEAKSDLFFFGIKSKFRPVYAKQN